MECGLRSKKYHIQIGRFYDFPSYPQVGRGYPSTNAIKMDSRLNVSGMTGLDGCMIETVWNDSNKVMDAHFCWNG
jgi:hypothetical protein